MIPGSFVTKIGYFNHPAILGDGIATVRCGLITLYHVDTPTGRWIGYLIIAGGGIGFAIQQGTVVQFQDQTARTSMLKLAIHHYTVPNASSNRHLLQFQRPSLRGRSDLCRLL